MTAQQKAEAFFDLAEAAGWEAVLDEDVTENTYAVSVYRAAEVIEIRWHGSALESIEYSHDGETFRNLPHVAAARRRLEGEPEPPKRRGRPPRAVANGNGSGAVELFGDVRILPRLLPFDLNEVFDDEIIDAVRGRTVVWWSPIRLGYESAQVLPARQRHIKITETKTGRAVLSFITPEGFRSMALELIAQVR
jgi:hypothetical protein